MLKKKKRTKKDKLLVKSKPITFKVTPNMHKEIYKHAQLENRTVSSFLINIVDLYLKDKKK